VLALIPFTSRNPTTPMCPPYKLAAIPRRLQIHVRNTEGWYLFLKIARLKPANLQVGPTKIRLHPPRRFVRFFIGPKWTPRVSAQLFSTILCASYSGLGSEFE